MAVTLSSDVTLGGSMYVGNPTFTPAALFSAGEQGAWYDPSDINSYMSGLGPELVTNGDFSGGATGWTVGSNWAISGGAANATAAVYNTNNLDQTLAFVVNKTYKLTFDISGYSSGSLRIDIVGVVSVITGGVTSNGSYTYYFSAPSTGNLIFRITGSTVGGFTGSIDNISVKEVTSIGNATMFTTSTGTTPVTAVEQAVGLILDKSQGAPTLGPELVTNTGGPFINTTGWSGNQATLSVVSGKIRVTATATGFASAWIPITVPVGSGSVSINIAANNGTGPGAVTFALYENPPSGSPIGTSVNLITSATNIIIFTTTDGNIAANVYFAPTAIGQYIEISSASIKRLPGNHAFQSTDASRPTLRARYNLLTYSEQFDNAAWTKTGSTITANATTSPDGTVNAEKLVENTAVSTQHRVQQAATTVSGTSYTYTVYLKAGERTVVTVRAIGTATIAGCTINLTAGTISAITGTATITNAGNGWYRVSVTGTADSTTTTCYVNLTDGTSITYTGDGVSGAFVWGAQLLTAADNTTTGNAYQRIAAATDYVTTSTMGGYTFLPYLAFDGSDDSLLTNSVDFSGTDEMSVFAGVTKLSDAAQSILYELSAYTFSNNCAFLLWAPSGAAAANYYARVRGSLVSNAITLAIYAAPITNVATLLADISSDSVNVRVNGASAATSTSDLGTGNYGNYPLYIGRRNNATLPFNGRIYSLIIRGAFTISSEVTSTEQWVAGKTGLVI